MKERLLAGYLEEGVAIGLPDELAPLAVSAGLDADEVEAVLAGDTYGDEVRADEARAEEIGISGVPFFVIDGRFAIPGAQDPDTILAVLERGMAAAGSGRVAVSVRRRRRRARSARGTAGAPRPARRADRPRCFEKSSWSSTSTSNTPLEPVTSSNSEITCW